MAEKKSYQQQDLTYSIDVRGAGGVEAVCGLYVCNRTWIKTPLSCAVTSTVSLVCATGLKPFQPLARELVYRRPITVKSETGESKLHSSEKSLE